MLKILRKSPLAFYPYLLYLFYICLISTQQVKAQGAFPRIKSGDGFTSNDPQLVIYDPYIQKLLDFVYNQYKQKYWTSKIFNGESGRWEKNVYFNLPNDRQDNIKISDQSELLTYGNQAKNSGLYHKGTLKLILDNTPYRNHLVFFEVQQLNPIPAQQFKILKLYEIEAQKEKQNFFVEYPYNTQQIKAKILHYHLLEGHEVVLKRLFSLTTRKPDNQMILLAYYQIKGRYNQYFEHWITLEKLYYQGISIDAEYTHFYVYEFENSLEEISDMIDRKGTQLNTQECSMIKSKLLCQLYCSIRDYDIDQICRKQMKDTNPHDEL